MSKFAFLLFFLSSAVNAAEFNKDIVSSLIERTTHHVTYDGSYFSIPYPNGDVPNDKGVCTDVIIRVYRKLGTDLQKLVHEDMKSNFSLYPSKKIWGLNSTDKNIDHRRVPNLQTFFKRHGVNLNVSDNKTDYSVGDIVTWMLPGNLPHIGIVIDQINPISGNPMIVHNIGRGPEVDDMIFDYKITGHYRFVPEKYNKDSLRETSSISQVLTH
ncbi:DUF1287 domain-containing protein [Shewanella frigidimarina]|uniref:DUF1287 domain-containing protein n=1 Tax=Shewanella frigidimarina TaxID=56812 RepID=UPI003D7A8290